MAQGIGLFGEAQEVFGPGKRGKSEHVGAETGIAQVAGLNFVSVGLEAKLGRLVRKRR